MILTDIGRTGLITSAFVILALTLLLHGTAFFVLTGGYPAVGQYFTLVFQKGWAICLAVYLWIGALVSGLFHAIFPR